MGDLRMQNIKNKKDELFLIVHATTYKNKNSRNTEIYVSTKNSFSS